MSVSADRVAGEEHNLRLKELKNVDPSRTEYNIVVENRSLKSVYKQLFEDARIAYNAKQKDPRRKVENYLESVEKSKQKKTSYEWVFQVGNKDTNSASDFECRSISTDILLNATFA